VLDRQPLPDVLLSGRLNMRDRLFDIDALTLLNVAEATPPRLTLTGRVGFGGAVALTLDVNELRPRTSPRSRRCWVTCVAR
jgi:hypothetical protein